jgi:predicted kinase
MNLVVVGGPPCAGKSTLANEIARELGWPLIAKDAIKEQLFDSLGTGDRDWSRRLSGASYALLFDHADELAMRERDVILEGNFRWPETRERFELLASRYASVRWTQVFCVASAEILIARFRARTGQRHAGHLDADATREIEAELRAGAYRPLPIDGTLFEIDTGNAIDHRVSALTAHLRSPYSSQSTRANA